jgi:hypothetical protein
MSLCPVLLLDLFSKNVVKIICTGSSSQYTFDNEKVRVIQMSTWKRKVKRIRIWDVKWTLKLFIRRTKNVEGCFQYCMNGNHKIYNIPFIMG